MFGGETAVWETDGGGPGFTSLSLTSAEGRADRQLILVGRVFDLGQDLLNRRPVPESGAFGPARTAVFCD